MSKCHHPSIPDMDLEASSRSPLKLYKHQKAQRKKDVFLNSFFMILMIIIACVTVFHNYRGFTADPFPLRWKTKYDFNKIMYIARMQEVFNENEKEMAEFASDDINRDQIIHAQRSTAVKTTSEHQTFDMRGYQPTLDANYSKGFMYFSLIIDPVLTQDLVFLSESLGFLYVENIQYVRYRGENTNDVCISFMFHDRQLGDFYVESKVNCDEIMIALTYWADATRVFFLGANGELNYKSQNEYDYLALKYYSKQPMHLELLEVKNNEVININYILSLIIYNEEEPFDTYWSPLQCKFLTSDTQYVMGFVEQRFIMEHIEYNLRTYNQVFVLDGILGKEKDDILYDPIHHPNTVVHNADENAMFHTYEIIFKRKNRAKFRSDQHSPEYAFDALFLDSDLPQYCLKMIVLLKRVNSHYVLYADSHCDLLAINIQSADPRNKGQRNIVNHFKNISK